MTCYYCDRIARTDPGYPGLPGEFDLGSAAPRCWRHWRYVCAQCRKPSHFMSSGVCGGTRRFFCRDCAQGVEEVPEPFWAWGYYYRYRSPWTGEWEMSLDRLEYEGTHPLQRGRPRGEARDVISHEGHLVRYPPRAGAWPVSDVSDADVRRAWDDNAERWTNRYDDAGDETRRYFTDPPMLEMLGDVAGLRVLDAGCGNGYLSRLLARQGAKVIGVEQSSAFLDIARKREAESTHGIDYHHGSIASMPSLPDASMERAVANHVLQDVRDLPAAVGEVFRVLKPGGAFVPVISHPCFAAGPQVWVSAAPDSPRPEDRVGWLVDNYFRRGPMLAQWRDFSPLPMFHRPLRDYWQAFTSAGFRIDGFEEPTITDEGRRELPPSRVAYATRRAVSCIFRLVKP